LRDALTLISEVRPRPLVGGLLSFLPGFYGIWDRLRPMGNYRPPEYGRSILKQRIEDAENAGVDVNLNVVMELGPGRSLAAPISALLDGANLAITMDAVSYFDRSETLHAFDELVKNVEISEQRAAVLRDAVSKVGTPGQETLLKYVAPWNDASAVAPDSVDFIFSISVLEHVTDPDTVYRSCFRWLRPGGVMAHKIDHSSHGITRHWNGQYWVADWLWRLVLGGRPYAINRWIPDDHRAAAERAGFEVVSHECVANENDDSALYREWPRGRFATVPRDSLFVTTSTIVLRKA